MSDMNLPTVTVENDGTTFGPFYVLEDEVNGIVSYEDAGTYALVPVDQMEKVWWCVEHGMLRIQACMKEDHAGDWGWLVSAQ